MRRVSEAVLDGRLPAMRGTQGSGAGQGSVVDAEAPAPARNGLTPDSQPLIPAPGPGTPGAAILDAGCGTGGNLRWLARFGRAYGVDLSPHALGFCARRRLSTVARASVLALPFAGATFDLVTSFDVIYHLDVADDAAALREMWRVLKPGGWALIRVPALEGLRSAHDAAVHTRQRYTLGELCDKLRRAGFELRRASYANSLLFPLAAASRLIGRAVLACGAPPGRGSGARQGAGGYWRTAGHASGEPASDVRPAPAAVNALCAAIMTLEARLIARADLPIGLSALALAQRPAGDLACGAPHARGAR
jgi:SAM-dependent methyltransferase